MSRVLFIHTLFPSQFHLYLPKLLVNGYQVRAVTFHPDVEREIPAEIQVDQIECDNQIPLEVLNQVFPGIPPEYSHHFLTKYQTAVAIYDYLAKLRDRENYVPDVVVSHEFSLFCLYVKRVYPQVRLICRMDIYHQEEIGMVQTSPEDKVISGFNLTMYQMMSKIWNLVCLSAINQADSVFCATEFDKSTFPPDIQPKMQVIFDGINTSKISPQLSVLMPPAWQPWIDQPFVLFATRSLEPLRGLGEFLQSTIYVYRKYPNYRFVIVGKQDDCCYGNSPASGRTWMETYAQKYRLPTSQIIQIGYLNQNLLLGLRQRAAVNVYLTYDWVLSWALIEAMSLACSIVASRTRPVVEFITDGETGRLVDIKNPVNIADAIIEAIEYPDRFREYGQKARQLIVNKYDADQVSDQFLSLLSSHSYRNTLT